MSPRNEVEEERAEEEEAKERGRRGKEEEGKEGRRKRNRRMRKRKSSERFRVLGKIKEEKWVLACPWYLKAALVTMFL